MWLLFGAFVFSCCGLSLYQRIYLGAGEKHQRDIQVAENNDDLNKTIQIKQPYPK